VINNDLDITYDNLRKLTYIDWIQYETTRHYGPVNGQFFRVATEDNNISTLPIMKGTFVTSQPMGNHYTSRLAICSQLIQFNLLKSVELAIVRSTLMIRLFFDQRWEK
jgi:hypothetical protein